MKKNPTGSFLKNGISIGVYEIRECIGEDPLGFLYRGWNHHLGSPVLIKEYFPRELAGRDPNGRTVKAACTGDRQRYRVGLSGFLEQARVLAEIQHDNVMRVHNALEFYDTAYMVMEIERGRRLSSLFADSISFNDEQLESVFEALLDGLNVVHRSGLLHGGIYPGSILIRPDTSPVLIDFCADKLAMVEYAGQYREEPSDAYASPEQLDTVRCISTTIDIYSLGATMFRCVTGSEPAPAARRIAAVTRGEADPLQFCGRSGVAPGFSNRLKLLDRMCKLDACQRPAGVSEIIAEITASRMTDESMSPRSGFFVDEHSRVRAGLWITGVSAMLVLGLCIAWYYQRPSDSPAISAKHTGDTPVAALTPVSQASEKKRLVTSAGEDGGVSGISGLRELSEQSVFETPGIQDSTEEAVETVVVREAETLPRPGKIPEAAGPRPVREILAESEAGDEDPGQRTGDLLTAANLHLKNFDLTTPDSGNAYSDYRAVLAIEPDNTAAREGLRQIVIRYSWLISQAMREGRHQTAKVYLQRAESVAAGSDELGQLRNELFGKDTAARH